MDPATALGVVSSVLAIVDALQKAYAFGKDVIKADDQREEFNKKLHYVETVMESVDTLIESEKAHPDQKWLLLLAKGNPKSPLDGLEVAIGKMVATLEEKKAAWRRKLRNFEWHSEKAALEGHFKEIDGFCAGIITILMTASIGLVRLGVTVTQGIDVTTKTLAAAVEEGREETKEINMIARSLALKFQESQKETKEIHLITKSLAAKFEEDREEAKKVQEQIKLREAEDDKRREESQKKDIEHWISPFDYQAQQREKLEDAAPTGKMFLGSPEFKNWKNGDVQLLRCYGPSGAGKTILSAVVLDHLVQELPPETPVLCIYFEQKPSFPQTINNVLGSLLKQLIQAKQRGLSTAVKDAYLRATRINAKLTQKEMKSLLEAELEAHDNVYIVVDALDEAPEDARNIVEKYIHRLCADKVKLMTTRREDTELSRGKILCNLCKAECVFWHHCIECPQTGEDRMDLCQTCKDSQVGCPIDSRHTFSVPKIVEKEIRTSNGDLESYVLSVIQEQMPDISEDDPSPPRGTSPNLGWLCSQDHPLLDEISKAIANAAKGRFLLAKQYTRSLGSKRTRGAVKRALEKLKGDSYSLADMIDEMYDDDMAMRIRGQDPESVKYAMRILAIVSTARRNLKLVELQHALATMEETTSNKYEPDDQLERQDILDMTKGLIRIDRDKAAVVRLDHRTLIEYFEKNRSKHFPEAEADLAKICLKYLNFDEFSRPCDQISDFAAKEESHAFISYAVQYWGDHVREATSGQFSDAHVVDAAVAYLQAPLRLDAYIQAAWWASSIEHEKWDVRKKIHPLHVCAWFDLYYLISALDYQSMDLDVREETFGQTPLMYACRRGNERVARRLMELGASVNTVSGRGRTALFEAVLSKKKDIVKLLLSPDFRVLGVDVNITNDKLWSRTALMVAAHTCQQEIVDELLKHDEISVNVQDSEGNTALSLASSKGHSEIVSALLRLKNIELNMKENGFGRTALSWAAEENHSKVVDLLLSQGYKVDPEVEDMRGGTAMLRAAEEGSLESLQKLMDFGVNVNHADEDGCTALHWASRNGHTEILKTLVEKFPDVDIKDKSGMTPFHRACQSGEFETGEFLLARGADSSLEDDFRRTPYIVAWQYGQQDLMALCRQGGTNQAAVPASTPRTSLPLWSLVIQRDLDMVKSRISTKPVDVMTKEPGTKNTVLHLAIIEREEDENNEIRVQILRTLLPIVGGYLNETDDCDRSPIHLAALYGNLEAVEALFEDDPEINEPDRFGLTPLAIAFRNGYFPIAVRLIEVGADIALSKINLQKMLFVSIELQSVKAVEFLIDAGADATAPDEFGRTVNHLARLSGEARLMSYVQSIKSSIWQAKRVATSKAKAATVRVVEVSDEVSDEVTGDQFPAVSQLPFRENHAIPAIVPKKTEATAIYA